MKILNLTIVSFASVLLQGCIGVVYIPPANSQTPKTELVHVSRLYSTEKNLIIVKINGITVMQPAFGGVRPFDFYVAPGTYTVDLTAGGTSRVEVGPKEAGKTMVDTEFLRLAGFIAGGTPFDYFKRGESKLAKGDMDGAIADYTKAINLNPRYEDAYGARGRADFLKGEMEGAIADCSKVIELNPEYSDAYLLRGLARKAKGELDGAIADYSKAIELKPDFADAYNDRGDAKQGKGDIEGANADHAKAMQLKAGSSK